VDTKQIQQIEGAQNITSMFILIYFTIFENLQVRLARLQAELVAYYKKWKYEENTEINYEGGN
jgi:hypothetical protein